MAEYDKGEGCRELTETEKHAIRLKRYAEERSSVLSLLDRLQSGTINLYDVNWEDLPIGFQNPHCDFAMVHAPSECEACDTIAFGLQYLRVINRTNFTGHHDPSKAPCPSEIFRSFDKANRWGGNHAYVQQDPVGKDTVAWLEALGGFHKFYSDQRELEKLKREREELDNKIYRIEYSLQVSQMSSAIKSRRPKVVIPREVDPVGLQPPQPWPDDSDNIPDEDDK